MPYSKDIRVGQGWFNTNVNWFYEYVAEMDEEIVVIHEFDGSDIENHNKQLKYRDTELNEEIERRVNEYISWKVFHETRKELDEDDLLPEFFEDDIWAYVYHHVCMFIRRKPTWYELNSTLPDEE